MAKTYEDYRVSIEAAGRRYKLFGHSVREDETLQVRFRSHPKPRQLGVGDLVMTPKGASLVNQRFGAVPPARKIHYHPSGRINLKNNIGETIGSIDGPPLMMLRSPLLLATLSPASMDQLDVEDKKLDFADYVFKLDEVSVKRVQSEVWIGPRGSFDGEFQGRFGAVSRVVYRDAGLYHVAYEIGEAAHIDDDAEIDGIKLSNTCLTGGIHPDTKFDLSGVPNMAPAIWSSPPAVSRQIRAFLEKSIGKLRAKMGQMRGSYEISVSLCADGAIAGVKWHQDSDFARYSFNRAESLSRSAFLYFLGYRPTNTGDILDVAHVDKRLCGGVEETVFVRRGVISKNPSSYQLYFSASDAPCQQRPYWRIPPAALVAPDGIIELITSID